jgi:hypothetical protein
MSPRDPPSTITLPLQPQDEATAAKGIDSNPSPGVKKVPTFSARGILAKYEPAPSAEEIDQNRAGMFANFPRDDS